jgi:DNA repair exonuclease SbcCD nuclease subunit
VNTKVNIFVVEPGELRMFNKFNLYVMDAWGDVDLPAKENKGDKPLVLAWHGVLPGLQFTDIEFVPKSLKESIKSILNMTRAQYIALGDIHRPIKIHKRCWYPGPPMQKTYADIDNVLIVEISKKNFSVDTRNLPFPKKITLDIKFEEGVDNEDTLIAYIKKNAPAKSLLRIRFELPLTVWGSINKPYIKKELSKRFSEIVLENDPIVDVRTRKAVEKISKAKSILEELDIALKSEPVGLNVNKLRKVCKRYI